MRRDGTIRMRLMELGEPCSLTVPKGQRLVIDFNDPDDHHYEIEIYEGCTPDQLAIQLMEAAHAIAKMQSRASDGQE